MVEEPPAPPDYGKCVTSGDKMMTAALQKIIKNQGVAEAMSQPAL